MPAAETPLQSSKAHQRLSERSSRRLQQQQGQLNAKLYLCLRFQSHFAAGGVKSQMCLTRFHFYFSKPSFSHQLLFAPPDPLAIFPQGKLEPPAQDNPGGVLTKGTQLCFNLWDCSLWSLAGPGWCLDCKRPELLTQIYILPHLTELHVCINLRMVEMSCALNHTQLFFAGMLSLLLNSPQR